MKKILMIVLWTLLIAGIGYLFVFANNRQSDVSCREFLIEIDYNDAPPLITTQSIRQQITDQGIRIKGQPLGSLPVEKIQQVLNSNPFVKKSTLRVGVDGSVSAFVEQRIPLLKAIANNGKVFYIDTDGVVMPLSNDFSARVVLANGAIKVTQLSSAEDIENHKLPPYKKLAPDLQKVYVTARAIGAESFTNAMIEQIYLNEVGEIELVPKIGSQTIILGDTINLNQKLKTLKIFYTHGMQYDGWEKYSLINLKFRDQVVCTKTSKNGSI